MSRVLTGSAHTAFATGPQFRVQAEEASSESIKSGIASQYFGASRPVRAWTGGTSETANFGSIVPSGTFTMCSLTRYREGGPQKRILTGDKSNWLHGHHNGNRGVAFYGTWSTAQTTATVLSASRYARSIQLGTALNTASYTARGEERHSGLN